MFKTKNHFCQQCGPKHYSRTFLKQKREKFKRHILVSKPTTGARKDIDVGTSHYWRSWLRYFFWKQVALPKPFLMVLEKGLVSSMFLQILRFRVLLKLIRIFYRKGPCLHGFVQGYFLYGFEGLIGEDEGAQILCLIVVCRTWVETDPCLMNRSFDGHGRHSGGQNLLLPGAQVILLIVAVSEELQQPSMESCTQ